MYMEPNKYYAGGTLIQDPTKVANIISSHTTTATGIWSQHNHTTVTDSEPYADTIAVISSRIAKLELNNRLLKLKILQLEGTFTKEEVINIRAMLMSNDEASITLADSIIENA